MTGSHSHPETSSPARTPFAFNLENRKVAEETLRNYPPGRQASAILPLLDLAQRQCGGWLPAAAIEAVAGYLGMPVIRAYEVATFYTMFNLTPVGKYHVQVCRTISCWLKGASDIRTACEQYLNIKPEGITPDGKFSLKEVECLGACINAPVIQINDEYHEGLTPESVKDILQKLALPKSAGEEHNQPDPAVSRKPETGMATNPSRRPRKNKASPESGTI